MEVPTPPIDPETLAQSEARRVSGQAYTVNVFASCPDDRDTATRQLLGHVTIQPGIVAPGNVAAVNTPDGRLIIRRIYYYRVEGGRESVRLESLAPGKAALCYPLSDVTVEGLVVCVCGVGDECGCE